MAAAWLEAAGAPEETLPLEEEGEKSPDFSPPAHLSASVPPTG